MKTLTLSLLFILIFAAYSVKAQVKQLNSAPLYELGGQSERGLAYFSDATIRDSLKVFFKVDILFKQPLQKESRTVDIKSVKLLEMRAVNIEKKDYPQVFLLTYNDKKRSAEYQDLWARYSKFITSWYEKLPYQKMQSSEYIGSKKITFIGVFMIVPQENQMAID